jgi:CRISPR-associated protein Csy2
MLTSQIAVGGPPLTAAFLFAQALCLKARLGVRPTGIAYIHHAITPLGQMSNGVFSPQQRRAASFTFTNISGKGYSRTNQQALSLQPTASAHLRLSLIIETEGAAPAHQVEAWLGMARFAGGVIQGHRPVSVYESIDDAFAMAAEAGFAVVDRRDLLEPHHGADPATLLVRRLGADVPGGPTWLSATTVGFAGITPFARRDGVREGDRGYLHAYCEPLVGLVQHVSIRQYEEEWRHLLWRPSWPSQDVFVLQQSRPPVTDAHGTGSAVIAV